MAPEFVGIEYFKAGALAVLAVRHSLVHGVVTGFVPTVISLAATRRVRRYAYAEGQLPKPLEGL
jgi:hypothetical protein